MRSPGRMKWKTGPTKGQRAGRRHRTGRRGTARNDERENQEETGQGKREMEDRIN
jgi:hypothetical protein